MFQSALPQFSSWFKTVEFETTNCSITITFLFFTLRVFTNLRLPSDQKILTLFVYLSSSFVLSSNHQRLRQSCPYSWKCTSRTIPEDILHVQSGCSSGAICEVSAHLVYASVEGYCRECHRQRVSPLWLTPHWGNGWWRDGQRCTVMVHRRWGATRNWVLRRHCWACPSGVSGTSSCSRTRGVLQAEGREAVGQWQGGGGTRARSGVVE